MKTKVNNCILLLLSIGICRAQPNAGFIQHLSFNHLQSEHRAYLKSFNQTTDTLGYYNAKYYLQYFNDSLLLSNYLKSTSLCANDAKFISSASKLILLQSNKATQEQWFKSITQLTESKTINYYNCIYSIANNPNSDCENNLPLDLQKSFLSYKKVYNKKPVIGMGLSALVPGLGKWYAGKPKSALSAFILNATYAIQTIESSQKLGKKHPLTVINASAFALFYLANIYGGYKAIIDLRKERKKQFISDAIQNYN